MRFAPDKKKPEGPAQAFNQKSGFDRRIMPKKMRKPDIDCQSAVAYALREITHICRDMKKRAPGSEGEREAAGYMAASLEKDCGCADVRIETFKEHPASFYSYFYFSAALDTLCAVSFFIRPWLSILFGCLAFMIFLFHFVLYKKPIDPFFPEKESLNVTAVRKCSGEVRQRVFLNGHIDAAWEFPLNYYFGGIVFETPGIAALCGVLFYIGLSACSFCGAGGWVRTAALCGLCFVPFFILVAFTYNPKRTVDGANDNLSGCYIGLAILREMETHGIILGHTEVGVILTGSEEAGLRGSKAWAKAHQGEYEDVPTYIISYDTIHDPKHFAVNTKDLNGTVKSDSELCDLFLRASEKAGVPCKMSMIPLLGGATDSAAFTQGGFRSIGITGLNHRLEDYYHTRRDSYDHLNGEGLENCIKATAALIDMLDGETPVGTEAGR